MAGLTITCGGAPTIIYNLTFNSSRVNQTGMKFSGFHLTAKFSDGTGYMYKGYQLKGTVTVKCGGTEKKIQENFTIKSNKDNWFQGTGYKYDKDIGDSAEFQNIKPDTKFQISLTVKNTGSWDMSGTAGQTAKKWSEEFKAPQYSYTSIGEPKIETIKPSYDNTFTQRITCPTYDNTNKIKTASVTYSIDDNTHSPISLNQGSGASTDIRITLPSTLEVSKNQVNVSGTISYDTDKQGTKCKNINSQSLNFYRPITFSKEPKAKVNEDYTVQVDFELNDNAHLIPVSYYLVVQQEGEAAIETKGEIADGTKAFSIKSNGKLKGEGNPSQKIYSAFLKIEIEPKANSKIEGMELPNNLRVLDRTIVSEPKPFYFGSKPEQYNRIYICEKQNNGALDQVEIAQVYLYSDGIKTLLFQKPVG